MASKYVDLNSIIQVIGCCYNNPQLLDQEDKYNINEEDFPDNFHQIIFGSIYKIHELGAKEITLLSIEDYLKGRPKSEAIFRQRKGDEWLLKASENSSLSTFDYYYKRLKKMTLLRLYDNVGIDVKDIYDPDNILDVKKLQEQEEYLDNASLLDIADKISARIDNIRYEYVDETYGRSAQAGDGIFDLIESLKNTPEFGIPMFGDYMNTVTRGARLSKFYLRSAASGYGKAIPNDTIIPTPEGYKMVGEIKAGDYLFDHLGKPTKVLQIHPQPEKKQIYEIVFSDGRKAQCCEEHLWEYRFEGHREYSYRVESLKDILKRAATLKNGLRTSDNRGYRFSIRVNKAVEYSEKKYSLPPYVLGAFLGDGSFRYRESQKSLSFSSKTEEIPNKIISYFSDELIWKKSSAQNYNYTFKPKNNLKHNIWVEEFLKDYPDLWNKKSEEKFIPKDYLMGSIEQRFELLRGLMDTDGTIDAKGRTSFTTISSQLRDDVIELCHSLGFLANYSIDKREKYTIGECYHISIQAPKNKKSLMFSVSHKLERALEFQQSNKRQEYKSHISIVDIYPLNNYTDMTCFTVDNKEHLFLMNDYIVTHNTRTMAADAAYMACNEIYYDNTGWVNNGSKHSTLFITTELSLDEVQTLFLCFLSNVDESHILNGRYADGEEERVLHAAELISQSPLYVEELMDFSLQDVENIIKKNIRENDVKYICLDYIHSSLKILEEISTKTKGMKLREDNVLFMLSNKLKNICNEYGVFIISATQLNGKKK